MIGSVHVYLPFYPDRDPFWEPADTKVLIGSVHVFLQSVAYLIDMDENLAITNFKVRKNTTTKAFPGIGIEVNVNFIFDVVCLRASHSKSWLFLFALFT